MKTIVTLAIFLALGSLRSVQDIQYPKTSNPAPQTRSLDPRLFIYPRFSAVKLSKDIRFTEVTDYEGRES